MTMTYHVGAFWDPEVGVRVATSEDAPGLATEAPTIEALTAKLHTLVPELLEANQVRLDNPHEVTFELTSHRQELVQLAS